jgi:hypothetical protein
MRTVSVRSLFFLLAITTTPAALSAQKAAVPTDNSIGCPVDFSLQRNTDNSWALSPVLSLSRPDSGRAKRSVHFSLRSEEGKVVTAADITLYAPRISNNATPATVVFGPAEDADLVTRTYHVVQGKFAAGSLTGDLDLTDIMAGVERAEIKRVIFSDGTTWRPVSGTACTATPPIFMLVAHR